jgi:hypothetical protein
MISQKIGALELDVIRRDWMLASCEVDNRRLKAESDAKDAAIAKLQAEVKDLLEQPTLALESKHSSDCAMHNAPAETPKPCDCGCMNGGAH